MKYIYLSLLFVCSLGAAPVLAQLGLGGTPHSSAVLDLKSPANDKAFYPPRLTTVQRLAIVNPQTGAMVFDLDKGTLYLHDGQNWLPLATSASTSSNLQPIDHTASDGVAGDNFGYSVAIWGNYALVGAYRDDNGGNTNQGSAYVFLRTGNSWSQQAKLTASDGAAQDDFGSSVAISGDYALVGAYLDDNFSNGDQGSVYVFLRTGTTWTQQAKLIVPDGAAHDHFGSSVALSGDYALVAAPNDAIGSNVNQGSAYVFVRSGTTWTQQAKLTASDGLAYDRFGSSVALSGDYALVGADLDDTGSNVNQGSAYMFVRSGTTWSQQAKLTASDGAIYDFLGGSVALWDDYALVGAPGDDVARGSAYVFKRTGTTWTQQAKLTVSDRAVNDRFGSGVAISGDYAVVGATNDDIGSNADQGSAYVFKRSGMTWTQIYQVTDTAPANTFNGISVGLSNGTFIIGGDGFQNAKGKVSFGTVD